MAVVMDAWTHTVPHSTGPTNATRRGISVLRGQQLFTLSIKKDERRFVTLMSFNFMQKLFFAFFTSQEQFGNCRLS